MEYKEVKLTQILEESDFSKVETLINKNKWKELRVFLNSINVKLEKKGILPDYLYYCLETNFKKN